MFWLNSLGSFLSPPSFPSFRVVSVRSILGLTALTKPIAKEIVELIDRIDLLNRRFQFVRDSTKLDKVIPQHDIAGQGVAISRLADAPNIDHDLRAVELILLTDVVRTMESAFFGKHAGDVRVPLKARCID